MYMRRRAAIWIMVKAAIRVAKFYPRPLRFDERLRSILG
jgi:hypothetical protein